MTYYYPSSVSDSESFVLKFVRHDQVRQIVRFILEQDLCTFNEIVEHTGKAPSTVSGYLKRLKEAGIVSVRSGEYQLYTLSDKETTAEVLSKYRRSFIDKVVESYVDMIEPLQ
jgi:DNA-binding transcriptional ArsR family regulator